MVKRVKKEFKTSGDDSKRYFIYHDGTPVEIRKTGTGVASYVPAFGKPPGEQKSYWHWIINNNYINLSYEQSPNWREVNKSAFDKAYIAFIKKEAWKYEGLESEPYPAA